MSEYLYIGSFIFQTKIRQIHYTNPTVFLLFDFVNFINF